MSAAPIEEPSATVGFFWIACDVCHRATARIRLATPLSKDRPMTSGTNPTSLYELLNRLDESKISYRLDRIRDDTVMIVVAVPGELWEIEYFEDGTVEVERFISDGEIFGPDVLSKLWTES